MISIGLKGSKVAICDMKQLVFLYETKDVIVYFYLAKGKLVLNCAKTKYSNDFTVSPMHRLEPV